jgi:origin recognition complex subunit 3
MKTFIQYLEINIIQENLKPADRGPPLIELFVFTDITTARQHLLGTPRASIHTALNNPNDYLQCPCCDISNIDSMNLISTMPDLSIAYKLHLECGRMINLFDWLQAFKTVISTKDAGDEADDFDFIDPRIQYPF